MSTSLQTVGELVATHPSLSKVFESFGIDYCCGGKIPLEQACENKGLALDSVTQAIQQHLSLSGQVEAFSPAGLTLSGLCDYIVSRHHQYLSDNLPRVSGLVDKVARVHGAKEPRLKKLKACYDELRVEIEPHLAKEEQVLFPYCKDVDVATAPVQFHCGSLQAPIGVMEREHVMVGNLLRDMRTLTDDYTPPDWACNTYRALFDALCEMEQDLHQHIHLENNVLFPQALAKANTLLQ